MKNNVYKSNFLTIWYYTFDAQDDQMYNNDIKPISLGFIGTKDEFREYMRKQQLFWGTAFFNIKKRHANAEQARKHKRLNDALIVRL